MRCFEAVAAAYRHHPETPRLPMRATATAAAYDFFSPVNALIKPGNCKTIWTDVRARFPDNEVLILNVRSSMGKHPVMLANTQGWIDSDYYNNISTGGNIGIMLYNLGTRPYIINVGDRIAQGMFVQYQVADNGNTDNIRSGGFGSTNEE